MRCFAVGEHAGAASLRDHLFELRKKGFNRLFQGGKMFEFSTPESLLEIDFAKPVFILVDRIAIAPDLHQRLVDTIETCYREAGEVIFEARRRLAPDSLQREVPVQDLRRRISSRPSRSCSASIRPFGACPRCQGFGNTIDFDMDRIIPDKTLSLDEGAVEPWTKPKYRSWLGELQEIARRACGFDVPFCDLTEEERDARRCLHPPLLRLPRNQEIQAACARLSQPLSRVCACPDCKGARLRKEALYVRVGGKNLADVVRMNIAEAQTFFDGLELSPEESAIADKILVEIRQRLKFLNDVGLDYLTLDRLGVHALRRRSAAHPTRYVSGVAAGGRVLCAR